MYVSAPHRSSNGTTLVNWTVRAGPGTNRFLTIADAIADAKAQASSTSVPEKANTTRAGMTNGIVSYKKYRNTSYSCTYRSAESWDRVITVCKDGSRYFATDMFVGCGYSGFHSTGFPTYLGDILPNGGSGSAQAVLNRAVMANMTNQAIAECLNKAKATDFDASEALAGLIPTVRMVVDRVIQVLRAWNAVRKGNISLAASLLLSDPKTIKRGRRKTFNAHEAWLELQYGWKPLISDIFDGVSAVNRLLDSSKSPAEQLTVVRRLTKQLMLFVPNTNEWNDAVITSSAQCSVEVRYRFKVNNPTVAYLSSINLVNPLYLAWVALPFSFLVDWILPVSDWLQALSAPLGLTFVSGYSSLRSWGTVQVSASSRKTGAYPKVLEYGKSSSVQSQASLVRTNISSWPIAVPYFTFPFTSETRIANAIALLNTSGKRR